MLYKDVAAGQLFKHGNTVYERLNGRACWSRAFKPSAELGMEDDGQWIYFETPGERGRELEFPPCLEVQIVRLNFTEVRDGK